MLSKGIPTHLITIIQKIYTENILRVNAGNGISENYPKGETRMPTITCFIQFILGRSY
jgi:hypothetical protein